MPPGNNINTSPALHWMSNRRPTEPGQYWYLGVEACVPTIVNIDQFDISGLRMRIQSENGPEIDFPYLVRRVSSRSLWRRISD